MNTNETVPAVSPAFRFYLHDVVRVNLTTIRTLDRGAVASIATQRLTVTRRDGSQVSVDLFAADGDASNLKIHHTHY